MPSRMGGRTIHYDGDLQLHLNTNDSLQYQFIFIIANDLKLRSEALDVGGLSAVEKRNFAGLLVGDGESPRGACTTPPQYAGEGSPCTSRDQLYEWRSNRLEIVVTRQYW